MLLVVETVDASILFHIIIETEFAVFLVHKSLWLVNIWCMNLLLFCILGVGLGGLILDCVDYYIVSCSCGVDFETTKIIYSIIWFLSPTVNVNKF